MAVFVFQWLFLVVWLGTELTHVAAPLSHKKGIFLR